MRVKRLYWKEILMLLLLPPLIWGTHARADGDYDAGARKSIYCAYCHGYDGNPLDAAVPRLAGRDPGEFIKRIQEMENKGAMHQHMWQAVQTGELSTKDLADLAAFYSRQPVHK